MSRPRRWTRSRPARIEELVSELRSDYTIVIVTRNMQQAARVSQHTAYMYLGELVEFADGADFMKPKTSAPRTTSPVVFAADGNFMEHTTLKQFELELEDPAQRRVGDGRLVEAQLERALAGAIASGERAGRGGRARGEARQRCPDRP